MNDSELPVVLRDIRGDLKQRLLMLDQLIAKQQRDFEKQREDLEKDNKIKVEHIKSMYAGIQRLLDIEEKMASKAMENASGRPSFEPVQPKTPLADFLCLSLAEDGPRSKDDLREVAQKAGYFGAGEGGRAIHATLVNLVRANRVVVRDDGQFEAAKLEKALL